MEDNLLPGERVLWEGRPVRRRLFRRTDALLVPFSVVWCGFAVFWEISAVIRDAPVFFVAWGVPFVLAGLYFVVGRFVVRAVSSRRTRYAITSSRLVIRTGWTGDRITTRYLRYLPPPVITEEPDGSGSLAFGGFPGSSDVWTRGGRPSGMRAWSAEPTDTVILWDVADVRRVRDLVAQAQPGNPTAAA